MGYWNAGSQDGGRRSPGFRQGNLSGAPAGEVPADLQALEGTLVAGMPLQVLPHHAGGFGLVVTLVDSQTGWKMPVTLWPERLDPTSDLGWGIGQDHGQKTLAALVQTSADLADLLG